MGTASNLTWLLSLKTKQIDLTNAQIMNSNRLERISSSFAKQQKYCDDWEKRYDEARYAEKDLKVHGTVYIHAGDSVSERKAIQYADLMCPEYDEIIYEELEQLDEDYETRKAQIDTELAMINAQIQSAEEITANSASQTGLLNSGS